MIRHTTCPRQVFVAGSRIHVPRREVGLIELLMRRFGRVVAKVALEESVSGFDEEVSPNAIEVAVYRLRTYLAKAGATVTIRTVRGMGYILEADARSKEIAGAADLRLQLAETVGIRDRE